MILTTERLILRPWEDSDAKNLFKYAKDPEVGPVAGWTPHRDVEESRRIIRTVLNGKESYAVCLKKDNKPIGAIELMLNSGASVPKSDGECELGFWLGKPFWGKGIIPEASKELLRRAFEDLKMEKVWCAYYDGNAKSKRTQEKLGFEFCFTKENVFVHLMNEYRTEHINCMTKEQWLKIR